MELCHPLSILMRTILKGWPRWWGLEDTTGLDWAQGEVSWVKAWCQCLAVGQVSSWSFGVPVCVQVQLYRGEDGEYGKTLISGL